MKASTQTILNYFDGKKAFCVPAYQRGYSWEKKDWAALWEDLSDLALLYEEGASKVSNITPPRHFLGGIYVAPYESSATNTNTFLIIDGQQRLITFSIFLIALRDVFCEEKDKKTSDEIDFYLKNHSSASKAYKIYPTSRDDDEKSYNILVEKYNKFSSAERKKFKHPMMKAYDFFKSKIKESSGKDASEPSLEQIYKALVNPCGLEVIDISLDRDDNAQEIFESLNATGESLNSGDLIRNSVLMCFQQENQEEVYKNYWLPLENCVGSKNLTEFFYNYLRSKGKKITKKVVYAEISKKLTALGKNGPDHVKEFLEKLSVASSLYSLMLAPDSDSENHLPSEALKVLNVFQRLEAKAVFPLALRLLILWKKGLFDGTTLTSCFELIESYIIRRFFSGLPSNSLTTASVSIAGTLANRPFEEGSNGGWYEFLSESISQISNQGRFPSDQELQKAFLTYDVYTDGDNKYCRYILECLMEKSAGPEKVYFTDTTIEHIYPQNPEGKWASLDEEEHQKCEKLKNTLGNLTLSGENQKMGNNDFSHKKITLRKSSFLSNRNIADLDSWTSREILARSEQLYRQALTLWKKP
ncbi:DUF262 domain-containing protein [Formicincola oecophyllae]|uniref:DUF262 domain-containing protein n=1 Tax=Formicincola oecophyllae TaxID=2558361 RepID=A0A4Y6U930_9PROT|nr:DUF262 domain-containing protein [Formicincola oecophyllae]QDH13973.1 DUF262 domain-containing protein [Formicincola oecophyllae]